MFFNESATTEIYTYLHSLSLPDALPIWPSHTICDPACGTAGFLVAAAEYLGTHHSEAIYKDEKSAKQFNEATFHGFDFDSTMLRVRSMNLLLHGVENPAIAR